MRIKKCEEAQILLEQRLDILDLGQAIPAAPVFASVQEKAPLPVSKAPVPRNRFPWRKKNTLFFTFIKENWLGIVGSAACVLGSVFFGITTGIFNHPAMRITAMLLFSFLFIGAGLRWRVACTPFTSTGAAIFLFATLGAGSIEGLQCIQSPVLALLVLCMGIVLNMVLATLAPSQTIASLHVILSLLAFCAAPQTPLLLPLGALVSIIGLLIAYQAKWNIHLLLIVLAFSMQNTFWSQSLALTVGMHYLAIGCSVAVAVVGALTHYRVQYNTTKLEPISLAAHITNWLFLTWNVYIHAPSTYWSPLVLCIASSAGFLLGRTAKKRGILWLYHVDTVFAQLLLLMAIGNLSVFALRTTDILLLALVEVVIFSTISQLMKEKFLARIAYFMQIIFSTTLFCFFFAALLLDCQNSATFCRMGIVILLNGTVYAYSTVKDPLLSLIAFLGLLHFICIYAFGAGLLLIQLLSLATLFALGFWRATKEDPLVNLLFLVSLFSFHLFHWIQLCGKAVVLHHRIDFIGLIVLDLCFVFRNRLHFHFWKRNVHDIVLYALSIQLALLIFALSRTVHAFIPPAAFLGSALLALAGARYACTKWETAPDVKIKTQESLSFSGIGFMILFICSFVVVPLDSAPLRYSTEVMAIAALGYWIAYAPKGTRADRCLNGLIDILLGFLTLCILIEVPDSCQPLLWGAIASSQLVFPIYFSCPRRLYIYSWLYLMASILPTQSFTLPLFFALLLQLLYAALVHQKGFKSRIEKCRLQFLFGQPMLTVVLPIFLGMAFLLADNYEKTLLTLFWVGLTCLYLSLGLVVKSKWSIHTGMLLLLLCCLRMLLYDLIQSDTATRAVVFLGTGLLMLCASILYKKFKYRLEAA